MPPFFLSGERLVFGVLDRIKAYMRAPREAQELRRQLRAARRELARVRTGPDIPPGSGESGPAFFVVGESKSGTGWLMNILDSHPEILCRGGGRFFGRDLRNEEHKEMRAGGALRAKIQPSSLQNAMLEAEYLRLWIERSVWSRDGDPEEHLAHLTRLAIDHFLAGKLAKSGKRLVGDKTPLFATDILGDTKAVYPNARVIHILRDGRDVAVSQLHQSWKMASDLGGPRRLEPEQVAKREAFYRDPKAFLDSGEGLFSEGQLRALAEQWRSRVGKAVEDGPALFGERYTEVRYENLLKTPEEEAGRIFGFLGAEAADATVRRCVESVSFERRAGRERGQENYGLDHGKYRKGIAGDWKNAFTEQDKAVFKDTAGDLLVELRYEENDGW